MKKEVLYEKINNYCKVHKLTYPDKKLIDFIIELQKLQYEDSIRVIEGVWKTIVAEQSLQISNLKKGIYEEEADRLVSAIRDIAEGKAKNRG